MYLDSFFSYTFSPSVQWEYCFHFKGIFSVSQFSRSFWHFSDSQILWCIYFTGCISFSKVTTSFFWGSYLFKKSSLGCINWKSFYKIDLKCRDVHFVSMPCWFCLQPSLLRPWLPFSLFPCKGAPASQGPMPSREDDGPSELWSGCELAECCGC